MARDHSPRFLESVAAARLRVTETDVQGVHDRLSGNEQFHLVDVREDSEWAEGHIPGALHIGKGVIERDIERLIPDADADIVLYCGGGYRSVLAAESLQRMGYRRVQSMDGGYSGWRDAGHGIAVPDGAGTAPHNGGAG